MLSRFAVQLIGRIGHKEVRTHEGTQFATLSVAVETRFTKDGEEQTHTTWVPVKIMRDATAKFVEQYIGVGDLVLIDGHGESRSFSNSKGEESTVLEVIVVRGGEGIEKLSSPKGQ
jgi:single-stranded DNA-binding protein